MRRRVEMKQLAEVLTKNPVIVVSMFIFTLLSTIAGLLVSWDDLYKDYLSKSISIPSWLLLLLAMIVFFGWIVYGTRKKKRNDQPIVLVAGQDFGVERLSIAGKRFVGCTFNGTEIVFDGTESGGFERCRFTRHRFTFSGAAALTLGVLTVMYKDPSLRPMLDETFQNIKSGDHPLSNPPSSSIK